MKKTIYLTGTKIVKRLLVSLIFCIAGTIQVNAQTPIDVQDSIFADTHWTCDHQYLLKGFVYVVNGTTLTIEAGTIIKGDKNSKGALIVERGAKIFANGTAENPVVFTSNQAVGSRTYGDWGGVIIAGRAPTNWTAGTNQVEGGPRTIYGGTDMHDNSGSLTYVRIEFAGIAFSPNNEVNGLSLYSIGDGTTIHHIQCSYSGDDSFEWFGGNVNSKYLVSYRSWDDDFDTDCGFSGNVQFVSVIRDPFSADQSGSKAFESDSYQTNTNTGLTDTTGLTKPVFSNCTIIGPLVSPTSTAFDPQFVSGIQIRRGSALSFMNSVLAGFPCGILIDESSASFGSTVRNLQILGAAGDSILQIRNNIICGIPTNGTPVAKEIEYVINGARNLTPTNAEADTTTGSPFNPAVGPFEFLLTPSYKNYIYPTEQNGVRLGNPYNLANPNLVPTSTSPVCYNAAHAFNPANPINMDTTSGYAHYNAPANPPSFSSGRLQNSFFTHTNYIGAFAGTGTTSDNWMDGWCNFDPVNTDYSTVCANSSVRTIAENRVSVLAYPNPSKGKMSVEITLVEATTVSIKIYDITGREIESVLNERLEAGHYSVPVSVFSQDSGIYFAKVNAGNITKTVKLVITK